METTSSEIISLPHDDAARIRLMEHFGSHRYRASAEQQANLLLSLGGYIDRFNYLQSILGNQIKLLPSILVSGYGAGSEMIVARKFGFTEIHGVEVKDALLEATKIRLADLPGMFPILYDGWQLPYDDEQYDIVVSGHIIEHTVSPAQYLAEAMRVLKQNGFLYIEFPTRYHHKELHSGLLSFEWLPTGLRNLILQLLSSHISFLKPQIKTKYSHILSSGLKQVSRRDIFSWLNRMNIKYKEIAYSKPAPGIIRCIIQKLSNGN